LFSTRPGTWPQIEYEIPNTFKSSNGDACVEVKHCGASTTSVSKGDVAGAAIKVKGPCHVECEFRYHHRARRTEIKRPGKEYLPVPACPAEIVSENKSPAEIGDVAVFEAWLQGGGIFEYNPKEDSRVYLAYRTLRHMSKTLVYSADPVTMKEKRGNVSTILSWGKTDCGGHTMVFGAVMRQHSIPHRFTLQDAHIFPEIYVADCGWVPCEATMKDPSKLGMADAAGHTTQVGQPHRLDVSHLTGGGIMGRFCDAMYTTKDVEVVWGMLSDGMRDHFKGDRGWLKSTGPDQGDLLKIMQTKYHPTGQNFMFEVSTSTGSFVQWTLYSDGSRIHGMMAGIEGAARKALISPDAGWDGEASLPGQDIGGQRPTVVVLKGSAPAERWQMEDCIKAPGVIGGAAQDNFLASYGWAAEDLNYF